MQKQKSVKFIYMRAALAAGLFLTSMVVFSTAFATSARGEAAQSSEALETEVGENIQTEPARRSEQLPATQFGKGARLMASFTIFLLAVFVGVEVINKVPPTLHTPLMSGSNAISGITVIGALLAAGHALGGFGAFLGLIAVVLAMINVVGGFLVTHRMLMMFKKR